MHPPQHKCIKDINITTNLIQIYIIIGPDVCSDNELRGPSTLIYTSWKFGRIDREYSSFTEHRKDVLKREDLRQSSALISDIASNPD